MNCGISSRDPEADTGADIRKVINMGEGSMAAKKFNLKLKIISSPLCVFFLRRYTVFFNFSNTESEIIILIVSFFHAPIVTFHCLLLLFILLTLIFKEEHN